MGCSGGKDSTALLLWAVYESGYPADSIRATFADTGNELDETKEHIRMLSERVHPIEWLTPERDFYELARHKKRFPGAKSRFCTTELKMIPSRNYCYKLLDEGHDVLLHTGVRASESPARAALDERAFDDWYALPVYRPLLRWSLDDVWAIHERYGIPRNPLYGKGFGRVGCAPCVMSRKKEIKLIAMLYPERIDMMRDAELSVDNPCGYSSFFPRKVVPKIWRSKEIITKDGERMKVATIDDVVAWSQTTRGGGHHLQIGLDFDEEPPTCSHTSGACE